MDTKITISSLDNPSFLFIFKWRGILFLIVATYDVSTRVDSYPGFDGNVEGVARVQNLTFSSMYALSGYPHVHTYCLGLNRLPFGVTIIPINYYFQSCVDFILF